MPSTIPKAVLYYSPASVWSAAVLLTLEEKGYADDEIDRKQVNLAKGDNYDPTFLRLNAKATVPTLVVPMQNTLSDDMDSRYKALTETEAIVEFLDKSRSAMSRTHTTSALPAPALAPATIAFSMKSKTIIHYLHSELGNPNNLRYLNARDDASLRSLSAELYPVFQQKQQTLAQYITEAEEEKIHASVKTSNFWREKKSAVEVLLSVYENGGKAESELDEDAKAQREEFFKEARKAWEVDLRDILIKVNSEIIGPYSLGDQFSVGDLHLAAWIARLVKLAGGTYEDDGQTAIGKLENHIGSGFALPKDFQAEDGESKEARPGYQSKLGAFWDAMRGRPSWNKVYGQGIY
ncbi:hypothetical protein Hypma_015549 [Hypsizygus marmoreus]|uniref:GST N-terminal domain-containing protein n=1 Tax=Hypsizygus marmoreus TaxID=39966 RepID=A0A369KCN9_HYPMA|nr:hypothetical protein Hypma_015549 [Hypsizygus marmoreus]